MEPSRTGIDMVDLGDHVLVIPTANTRNVLSIFSDEADFVTIRAGLLDKFANISSLQKARADIEPGDNGFNNGPDFNLNISRDVLFALRQPDFLLEVSARSW